MKFRRPRSLNGLILVGFALVVTPLLVAVLWALFNLDRLAKQSEQLVITGVSAAENNRLITEQIGSLERVSRQYVVLRNADSLALLRPDFVTIETTLGNMHMLAERAEVSALVASIQADVRRIVTALETSDLSNDGAQSALNDFALVRQQTAELTTVLSAFIDQELAALQESTRHAQQVSAWQTAALVPGTIIMVLFFTLLVSRSPVISGELVQSSLGDHAGALASFSEARNEFTGNYLSQILQITSGNVSQAARLAKRIRTDFYKLLARHDLNPDTFKVR